MEGSWLLMFRQFSFLPILALAPLLLNLPAQAQQPGASGTTTSGSQLPLSGRTGQTGNVTTNQSTVNSGGANSVNLINSTVNVQGPYTGSVQNGKASATPVSLTLAEAIRQGLAYNLGSVSSAQGIRQAQGQRYEALNALLPQINGVLREDVQQTDLAALGLKFNFPGVPKIVGPYNYFDLRATLNQTLADLVKIRNLRVARENVKTSELTAKDARDLIVMAVGGSYLQVGASAARVNVARAEVETAEAVYKQASDRNIAGLNAKIDATRSRVELQTEQQRLRSLQADYEKQKLTLARIIGMPLAQEFSLADDFPFQSLEGLTQEQALDKAFANRADLQAAQSQVRAAEMARKAVLAERYPTAGISTDYGVIGENPAQSHGTFTFSGSVNFPIFQGTRVKGDLLQADAALQQRKAELEDLRGRVDYDIRNAYIDLRSAADQITVAKSNVDLAQEALTQARDRFAAGVADTVEVTQAQESVATANNDYINAVYSHNLAKVTLARAIGQAEQSVQQFLKGK
jgi:outer membrane protein TolC